MRNRLPAYVKLAAAVCACTGVDQDLAEVSAATLHSNHLPSSLRGSGPLRWLQEPVLQSGAGFDVRCVRLRPGRPLLFSGSAC